MKLVIKIGLLAILSLVILSMVLAHINVDRITPTQASRLRMAFLRLRILEYARTQGQLPADLSALSLKPDEKRYLSDSWNRKIIYEVEASGTVTLKSFGKDGLSGGSGRNADIVVSFPSRRPNGIWSEASDRY